MSKRDWSFNKEFHNFPTSKAMAKIQHVNDSHLGLRDGGHTHKFSEAKQLDCEYLKIWIYTAKPSPYLFHK